MLFRVLYSSINSFFNKNTIGKVLNRMSGDLMKVDRDLSYTTSSLISIFANLLINVVLITIFTKWYLGLIYLVIFIYLIRLRN